ncbi:N-acetylmuramoyl-L-alanine amidase [Terrilactibacillus sp. S3-3]|nr:N-acetylmuramoyl-L-alanine amidase [Terrilactibacillus sp. S3-3]
MLEKTPNIKYKPIGVLHKNNVVTVVGKSGHWLKIIYGKKSAYVSGAYIKKGTPPVPKKKGIKGKVIVLDPGHGGVYLGAVGKLGNKSYQEKKILTLQTAKLVAQKLQKAGAKVYLTRTTDKNFSRNLSTDLEERVKISKAHHADAFVSIHYNSEANHAHHGVSTYYYFKKNKELASTIESTLVASTHLARYNTPDSRNGVHFGDFHVLRTNPQPAILAELGFLSNTSELKTLITPAYQDEAAQGIVNGLVQYFKNR